MAPTPAVTNYEEIQQNEIEVLRSIFMEDFEEEEPKAGAWNKIADRGFRLKLRPTLNVEADLTVTLVISFPVTYPKTLPHCSVLYPEGFKDKTKLRIETIVRSKPTELLGSEVTYELAISIQEALDEAVVALAQTEDLPALAEERLLQEAATNQKLEEAEAEKILQLRQVDEEEDRVLEEMVEAERARMGRLQQKSSKLRTEHASKGEIIDGVSFDQEIESIDSNGTVVAYRTVHNKVKCSTGPFAEVYTVHHNGASQSSKPFLALKECILSTTGPSEKLKKAVQHLEVSLEAVTQLPVHASILRPLAFHISQMPVSAMPNECGWTLNILNNLATKGSLRNLLDSVGTLQVEVIRSWTIQIIEGLEFLHSHQVAHGRLHTSNILLYPTGNGTTSVKLTDVLFENEIHMIKGSGDRFSTGISAYWFAPEITGKPNEKLGMPRDIWDLGVVLTQMLFGMEIQDSHTSPDALLENLDLSQSLRDLLSRLYRKDPRKRPSPFDLLPSEFLRNNDPILEHVPSSPTVMRIPSSIVSQPYRTRHDSTNNPTPPSRYATDFVESGRLGKGGFGEVVRARNKLDGNLYAIKKITQNSGLALDAVISEILLLSRLNHAHVVRYYAAWIESDGYQQVEDDLSDSSSSSESSKSHALTDSRLSYGRSTHSGLDPVSSSGFPEIEFGYDSEDEQAIMAEEGTTENEDDSSHGDSTDGKPGKFEPQRRRSSVCARSTLYIQMEYCEKQTLRDLILHDLHANTEECWRLFRQILEGLVHVHSSGVIHRDLKPENIFIKANNVRLGDFGLARPGDYQAPHKIARTDIVNPSMTKSIGTSLYVAPEVRSSGDGKYNEKADMYSLGIILFEMCYALTTGMERAQILGRLREYHHSLPPLFDSPEYSIKKDVIVSLVTHKVSDRPSSQELLRSGQIPLQFEDESIRSVMEAISDPSSMLYARLLNMMFAQTNQDTLARSHAYDLPIGPKLRVNDLVIQRMVREKLVAIFSRHGAVETQRSLLIPHSEIYPNTAVRFLDASGTLVQLPYDLTLPHARILAKSDAQDIGATKSYTFGDAFRESSSGLHPRRHAEVDFDIVSDKSLDLALREAEVIKVVDEIMDAFPSLASAKICYHVNHSILLEFILKSCDIPEEKWASVKEVIAKLNIGQWTWMKIRNELRAPAYGVSSMALDELMRFDFRDTSDKALPKLRSMLQDNGELESTFRHLEALMTYLDHYRVRRKIFISPLSSFNDRIYHGSMLFQCVFDSKRRDVLIAGGRYDALIREHQRPSKVDSLHAVGFSLGWEKIYTSMLSYQSKSAKFLKKEEEDTSLPWIARRCDVLVDSFIPTALRSTGLELIQELWANDISAELAIDGARAEGTNSHQVRVDGTGHDWLVIIKQENILKVRSLIRKEDVDIHRSELVGWLRSEMHQRDRSEAKGADKPRTQHHSAHTDSALAAGDHEPDVRVLTSLSRSKKTNRRNIVADAQSRTRELANSFLDGPIAAVEMKDEVFEGLRETRLSDPDSWRKYINNAPSTERLYLGDLHQLLRDMAAEGNRARTAFVYNFRTRACICYELGRT